MTDENAQQSLSICGEMSINVEAWLRIDLAFRSDRLRRDWIKRELLIFLLQWRRNDKMSLLGAIVATLRLN